MGKYMKPSFRAYCFEKIKTIKELSGLSSFKIYLREARKEHEEIGMIRYADNEIDLQHFESTITVYPPLKQMYDEGNLDYVDDTIAHEIAHIITEEYYEMIMKASKGLQIPEWLIDQTREKQTQMVANIIYKLYKLNK